MHYQELSSAKYLQNDASTSIASSSPPANSRRADDVHGTRTLILLGTFVSGAVAWFYLLPLIQTPLMPRAPGGSEGPWIIRPNVGSHILASLFLASLMVALVQLGFRKKWKAQNAIIGPPSNNLHRLPSAIQRIVRIYVYAAAISTVTGLLLVSAVFFVLYLGSWSAVTAEGIELHRPWSVRQYSFAQVMSLGLDSRKHLPFVSKDDKYAYELTFSDGSDYRFCLVNEGLSETELSAIAELIAQQTGKQWLPIPAKPRSRTPILDFLSKKIR